MNEAEKTVGEEDTRAAGRTREERASLPARIARRLLLDRLSGISVGRLRVSDSSGTHTFGHAREGESDIAVRVTDPDAWLAVATGGTIGAAEAYMRGHLVTSDLVGLIRLFLQNRHVMQAMDHGPARLGAPVLRLAHWWHRNTRRGSRRNIRAHYDLGNELFELFLDPTMMYSSAVFPREDMTLEQASLHKLDLICRRLELCPEDHLLEIGTGWGGLAVHAARHYGCRVTTTTISENQFAFAVERVRRAGLEDRVRVVSKDYRDLEGEFDKLVSVEMIEAVGHRFLDTYIRACSDRLRPTGRMLIQAIVIADRHYARSRRNVDFIQKYIFPGGALPSLAAILDSVARVTDLQLTGMQDIGADYARTLMHWRERFLANLQQVRQLGYPEEFIRRWEWYLAYCEGGFRERTISDVQLVFDKPGCRLPPPVPALPASWAAAPAAGTAT